MPESEEHLLDAVSTAVEKYFKSLDGAEVAIPVECGSSEFRRFLAFFPHLLSCIDGGVSAIDEMYSGSTRR